MALAAQPGLDLELAYKLADLSVERGAGHRFEPYFWHVKALADYRRGNYEQGLEWSQRISQSAAAANVHLSIASRLLAAMSLQRLGRSEEARLELEEARNDFEAHLTGIAIVSSAVWSEDVSGVWLWKGKQSR